MHSPASLIQGHCETTPIVISAIENITLRHFRNKKLQNQPSQGTIVIQGRRMQIVPGLSLSCSAHSKTYPYAIFVPTNCDTSPHEAKQNLTDNTHTTPPN